MPVDPNQLLQDMYAQDQGTFIEDPTNPSSPAPVNMPNATPYTAGPDPVMNPTGTPANSWTSPNFNPTQPAPQMMTLDEMIDIINRKTELSTKPRLDALDRSRETMMYEGNRRMNTIDQAYQGARQDMVSDVNRAQQQTSQTMARRGIYDSGLAQKLGTQIARQGLKMGLQLGEKQAQELADVAEFIHLQQKHNMDEIQSIMGEKALMAASFLDEMRMEQQARGDMLAQQEFENWLNHQAFQLNEYWRQTEFDAGRADQEWSQWFNQEQFRVQQEQAEWERVFNMNKWEAEREMQTLLYNHQITQAEFNNAMALDDFNLRKWLYQAQNKGGSSVTYSQPAAPKASEGGMWWNLF